VTAPGEGTFTYDAGTVVHLVAEADDGYQFVNWNSVPFRNIADVRAAATTVVMNSSCYVTASFAVPVLVRNWYDLNATRDNLSGLYILMNDLNATTPGYDELAGPTANGGKGWQPITSTNVSSAWAFFGTFDGQGHEISDLVINSPDDQNAVGLFAAIGDGGGITNLGLVNVTVTGSISVGALAGVNLGTVTNCYAVSSVSGTTQVGGVVGWNAGTVASCYSVSDVNGAQSVGGLVGGNGGSVSDCSATGSVGGSSSYIGGLVGYNGGAVSDCSATGSVSGSSNYVGGLVGYNGGSVSDSFWDTQTSGQSTSAGGTGKTTAAMQDITTFSGASWDITTVADPGTHNAAYIWNIVDGVTYPFLSWQP
jgi:hypothetical protein